MKTFVKNGFADDMHNVAVRPLRYFEVKGQRCFVYRGEHDRFWPTEYRSGLAIGMSGETIKDAIVNAKLMTAKWGRKHIENTVRRMIKKHGAANPRVTP